MSAFDDVAAAVYRRDVAALELLTPEELNTRDQDGRTPLMHAVLAEDADPNVIALLIARGADVAVADNARRWTALHFAAADGREALVRLLLEGGAPVDPVDSSGDTPLWRNVMSCSSGLESMQVLLEHGADPRLENQSGISPAEMAREAGLDEVMALFAGRA